MNNMQVKNPIILIGELNERDDDCACPEKAFQVSFSHREKECGSRLVYSTVSNIHTQPLENKFHLVFSPYTPGGPSVLNQDALERLCQFQESQPLSLAIDHELASQHLISPVNSQIQVIHTDGETLTAWLHITNACNLDCPYCYVRKSSARMDELTGLQAIRQIFMTAKKHQFRRVKLKYAGGEATLHFKLVKRLHNEAIKLAQETGIDLREVVLSNGVYLHKHDVDWLAANDVKLMISVDGIGEVHDRQRPLKNGGETFKSVEYTIDKMLLPSGIYPDITLTLTQLNAKGAANTVRWALDRGLPVSLNFYRQNLLTSTRVELDFEEKTIIDGMLAAYQVIEENLPLKPFLNGLLDRVQAEAHAHTCGVQHSYVVITHEGKLAQCQMHLDNPIETKTSDNLLLSVAGGPIQNLSVDNKEGCRACEFRYRCTGGCPLETYRATGRWNVKSPHCRIYKTLYPAALRLEGLRLLKKHHYLL